MSTQPEGAIAPIAIGPDGIPEYRIEGAWSLPVKGPTIAPVDPELVEAFREVSSATASAKLHQMGITRTFIEGPRPTKSGRHVVGRAVTLQFMPMREDIYSDAGVTQEYVERATALWAVLDFIEPGDVLVAQAYGSLRSGVVGEMLAHHLHNRGGVGLVVDGGIRDSGRLAEIDLPIWANGATPHYASQGTLLPWGYHVPVAVGGALVLPGDLIVADDDGAVVVPIAKAWEVVESSRTHEAWEDFSRAKLAQGGALRRYYPLDDVGLAEYEAWERDGRPPVGDA
ncbi:dimethylmenaquinone methyltransferase [Microbacterium luteolum]|uniref:RraA family protein n=1 Tax=Microbacterium luteolum TaxID=69367 RepID=UPI002499C45C|nr:ribonuclease activity regulator RraA [Microbacterium luteolum]